ncbi:MAG: helix-turn-helix transcriptional regulator [Clostridia bacterium]|nr:helix-turn-helix transcriptional regulator [Clostridia bacterium]
MNSSIFYECFSFSEVSLTHTYHCDSSRGTPFHHIRYMKSGTGKIISDSGKIEIKSGEMFYIPKGLKYHSYWQSEDIVSFDSFGFAHFPHNGNTRFSLQKINYTQKAYNIYSELACDKTVDCRSVGLLYLLMWELMGNMICDTAIPEKQALKDAIAIIENNPTLKNSEIAKMSGVSESTLYTLFKKELLSTPNDIKRKKLCEKAMEMLRTTDIPIEEISSMLDFSSSSYFRKIFAKETGKTPRQYRKENVI